MRPGGRRLDGDRLCVGLRPGAGAGIRAARHCGFIAGSNGATVIEINPDFTPLSKLADFVLREKAGTALPAIAAAMLAT